MESFDKYHFYFHYYETLMFEAHNNWPICLVSMNFHMSFNVKLKCGIKKENSVIAIIILHVFNSFLFYYLIIL